MLINTELLNWWKSKKMHDLFISGHFQFFWKTSKSVVIVFSDLVFPPAVVVVVLVFCSPYIELLLLSSKTLKAHATLLTLQCSSLWKCTKQPCSLPAFSSFCYFSHTFKKLISFFIKNKQSVWKSQKSLILHCEQSEQHLHFEWTKSW